MSPERAKIVARCLKLKELAERGVDGEKDTAQRMYIACKQKYNIQEHELKTGASTPQYAEYDNYTLQQIADELREWIILGYNIYTAIKEAMAQEKPEQKKFICY